jgi:hypothetical protein
MNNEQQSLIDKAYENYKSTILEKEIKKSAFELTVQSMSGKTFILPQEEFLNKCQTDKGFSEKWGLEIEERELSTHERLEWVKMNLPNIDVNGFVNNDEYSHKWIETLNDNIPTKLITVTYNDKTKQ